MTVASGGNVENNTTNQVDYTDTNQFPAYTDKLEIMSDFSDFQNEILPDPMYFLARIANTDLSGVSNPTAALTDITDWGNM